MTNDIMIECRMTQRKKRVGRRAWRKQWRAWMAGGELRELRRPAGKAVYTPPPRDSEPVAMRPAEPVERRKLRLSPRNTLMVMVDMIAALWR